MADRPPQICQCGKATDGGKFCEVHAKDNRGLREQAERNRRRRAGILGGLRRFYDTALWRVQTRRFILGRDPLCRLAILCGGRDASVDVDHRVRVEEYIARHGGDETFFFDPDNLRGCCHRCHAYKTALENRGGWNEEIVVKALALAP